MKLLHAPTAYQVLVDAINRHYMATGEQPKIVRATRSLRLMFSKEVRPLTAYDPSMPAMPTDEFVFMGIRVKCDLPGNTIAALAIHQ